MQRAELLDRLKQPQILGDLIAGSVAAIGLFGCFYPTPFIKQLSFTALLTGVASLGANATLAKLYAATAANVLEQVLERELRESQQALSLSETQVLDLNNKIAAWETFWSQQESAYSQMKASLLDELREAIEKLKESHHERDQLEKDAATHQAQMDRLNDRIAALQEQVQSKEREITHLKAQQHGAIESLADKLKHSLSQAITEWKDNLLDSLQSELHKQPALAPRLEKISGEAKAIATGYYQQIVELPTTSLKAVVNGALSLQHHSAVEFAALKVRYRNALSVEAVKGLQSQIESQKIEIADLQASLKQIKQDSILLEQHEAILSEFKLKQQENLNNLVDQAETMEADLHEDTDAFVQKLLKQIDDLTSQNTDLQAQVQQLRLPRNFNPATREDLRMGNQIIEFFWRAGLTLDRAGSDYKKHEATLHFHTDRNPRLVLPADLNEHAHKLQQVCRCLNLPEFRYDPESGLMSVHLQLSRRPAPDPAEVLKTVGTAEDFLKYLSTHPIAYRLIGDRGQGKTPFMAVMVSHFLKIGARRGNVPNGVKMSKVLVGVSYPNVDFSQKDKGYYPLEPFLFARNDEECKKAIATIHENYQLRRNPRASQLVENFFQIWVLDEADNTLDFSAEGSASKMRSVFNDGGHSNIGWIFGGQSVNTRVLKGWTNDDRKKSTEIVIGPAKIQTWANEYGKNYYGADQLKAILSNLEAVREVLEKENESIADAAKHLRIALVADPISPKLFLLPDFNNVDFDLDSYSGIRMEADQTLSSILSGAIEGISASPASNLISVSSSANPSESNPIAYSSGSPVCPKCGTPSTAQKGKPESNKQRYYCRNPLCTKKTFTISLVELLNSNQGTASWKN